MLHVGGVGGFGGVGGEVLGAVKVLALDVVSMRSRLKLSHLILCELD